MAYEPKKKGQGLSDKPEFKTSSEVLADNRNEGSRIAARIAGQKKPHLAPGELTAIWDAEKAAAFQNRRKQR